MTVAWGRLALEDRTQQLVAAFERAMALPDPHLFIAAVARDDAIENEGEALDGPAVYRLDAIKGTFLYATRDGRYLIAYQRDGNDVYIDRVLPTRRSDGS